MFKNSFLKCFIKVYKIYSKRITGRNNRNIDNKSKIKIPRVRKAPERIKLRRKKIYFKKESVSNRSVSIFSPSVQNVFLCSSSH